MYNKDWKFECYMKKFDTIPLPETYANTIIKLFA